VKNICAILATVIVASLGVSVTMAGDSAGTDPGSTSSESCYLFSYFVGNGEDGLHLAHSSDGYKWEAINHRIYSTTTRDFKTFTPTRLFFDGGFNVIDATMLHTEGKYYLIVKDETLKPVKKNLRIAIGNDPKGPFGEVSAPFTPSWVEGPSAIRIGDDYVVYFDCYRDHHYGAIRSRNLKDWEDITSRVSFPQGTRHGTVLQVPKSVIAKLSEAQ
jgi:beta-xylosidase